MRPPLARALIGLVVAGAGLASAQVPSGADAARLALADLAPRYAQEFGYINGWYRGIEIRYYDFGPVNTGVADVYWPIHGFGLDSVPVPLRGQEPVFSTIPGLPSYTSLWRLKYVIVADNVKPNELTSVRAIEQLVARKRAVVRDAGVVLNLPIVPRGSYLEGRRDVPTPRGWFEGTEIAYFDFGPASQVAAPIHPFFRRPPAGGEPVRVEGQRNVVDVIPDGITPAVDLWDVHPVMVDSTYIANTVRDFPGLRAAAAAGRLEITKANSIRNCPVALIGDMAVPRALSPLARFAIPPRGK
jgi:hypothetical protein